MSDVRTIRDGDNRYRVIVNGTTAGFVTRWNDRGGSVNVTGVRRFSASTIGGLATRSDCPDLPSAVAFIAAAWLQ